MGLDLHSGRPRAPYAEDMTTLREAVAGSEAAEAALSRIDERIKEAGADYDGWDYGAGHACWGRSGRRMSAGRCQHWWSVWRRVCERRAW